MSEFSVYCYQCAPIRISDGGDPDSFPEELRKADAQALENMKNHQAIIGQMLTTDVDQWFLSQKKGENGDLENCTAFTSGGQIYPFKVLMPQPNEQDQSVIMLRIAKLTKKNKEHNFTKGSWVDEPSALVVIDNRHDQQRILIEHTAAWPKPDTLCGILKQALGQILREKYHLALIIESVWRKADFWQLINKYRGKIRYLEFEIGYPNLGRCGDTFLSPLKTVLRKVYGAATIRIKVDREVRRILKEEFKMKKQQQAEGIGEQPDLSLQLDPDNPDRGIDEVVEDCAERGTTARIGLAKGREIKLGKIPESARNRMSEGQNEHCPDKEGVVYSTVTVNLPERVSSFDGQDDLFQDVRENVVEQLNSLKEINAAQ